MERRSRDKKIKLKELWSQQIDLKKNEKYMLGKGKKEELDQRKGGKCQKETHILGQTLQQESTVTQATL